MFPSSVTDVLVGPCSFAICSGLRPRRWDLLEIILASLYEFYFRQALSVFIALSVLGNLLAGQFSQGRGTKISPSIQVTTFLIIEYFPQ